jgi:diguanylate cyclase (GGDEF)-like protein
MPRVLPGRAFASLARAGDGQETPVPDQTKLVERLGPQARLRDELSSLESHDRDIWILVVFAAAVLLLGALSLLVPGSFWQQNTLEMKIPPQVLFLVMMVVMVLVLYMVRREVEVRKLRLVNVQHALSAQSELAASMVDSLTNVFSRSFLRELLQGEISRSERNNRPLGLIMCDVDNFKSVNDRFGHLMGDYVLAQIAGILKSCVRGSDYVVRYGGDEFLIVLSETDAGGSQIVMKRIRQKVSEWDRANRLGDFSVGVSLGLHQHVAGQSVEQAVSQADARMYAEKLASREGGTLAANRPT